MQRQLQQQRQQLQSRPPERLIVVARGGEDTSWLHRCFGDIPMAVYQRVDNLTQHRAHCPPGGMPSLLYPWCAKTGGGTESPVVLSFRHVTVRTPFTIDAARLPLHGRMYVLMQSHQHAEFVTPSLIDIQSRSWGSTFG